MEHAVSSQKILMMTLTSWAVIAVFFWAALRKTAAVPGKVQNLLEFTLEFIFDLADSTIGSTEKARPYYPLFASLFFFVLISNFLGLIPGMMAPTASLNTTLALGLVVFVYYNYLGFKKYGFHYIASFFGMIDLSAVPAFLKPPIWVFSYIILPAIEIISHCIRPFSLAIRLFGNMLAKETLLSIFSILIIQFLSMPDLIMKVSLSSFVIIFAPMLIVFGVLVSFIQACVFVFLTILYIAGAIKSEH